MTKRELLDTAIEENYSSMESRLPIMPEHLERFPDSVTYEERCKQLHQCGLTIKNVVHDPHRIIMHTYYCDVDHGLYCQIFLDRDKFWPISVPELYELSRHLDGNICLLEQSWLNYYRFHVPVPLQAYDFKRRMRQIVPEQVFEVWHEGYKRLCYENGTWSDDTIRFILAQAPALTEQLDLNEHGMVTLYRGGGDLSQAPEQALSWSTSPVRALWFANHSGKGTHFIILQHRLSS